MQYKDFIGKKGFNKLNSPFLETIEKRGCHLFYEHKAPGFVDVVKEFYSNRLDLREKSCYVKGKWISFSREKIDETFNLKERNGLKFKKLLKEPDYQNIVDLLIDGMRKWSSTRKNPHESIARGSLIEETKVWFYWLSPFTIQTPQYNKTEGGYTLVCYPEGIQI